MISLQLSRDLQLVRQSEAAECGLACLAMIAGYHGLKTDLTTLRKKISISQFGTSVIEIKQAAKILDLGVRPVRCEIEGLRNLKLPAILHWDMDHFVVLKSIRGAKATIYDPARGVGQFSFEQLGKHFTGVAVEISPLEGFIAKDERTGLKLFSLIRTDRGFWRMIAQGFVLSIVIQFFVLLAPFFTQLVIDDAILSKDISLLLALAVGFSALKLFEAMSTLLRGLVFQYFTHTVGLEMKARLFHHLIKLDLPYFQKRQTGDIQQRFSSILPIQEFITKGAISATIDGVLAVALAVALLMYNVPLALLSFAFVGLFTVIRIAFINLAQRRSYDVEVAVAEENTNFLETLRAIQTIKITGLEQRREAKWTNLATDSVSAKIGVGNIELSFESLSLILLGLSNIVVVYLAATNVINGTMTIGMLVAFLAFKALFEQRIKALIESFVSYRMLSVYLNRLSDIALTPYVEEVSKSVHTDDFEGNIEFRDLSFQYSGADPFVIENLNLSIAKGEFLAITAPSGTGKSTLLKILTGLYEPTFGLLLYDGRSLDQWGRNRLLNNFGVVMQDDQLLSGTIEDNISLFSDKIENDRLVWAARCAGIHEEIARMPMGYSSLVGDMGSTLSGGQKQRVLLARALYRKPKILVLDESFNQLDLAKETEIMNELCQLDMTIIMVAHRKETLSKADRVIAL